MSENISEYVKAAKQGSQHAFSKLFELTNQSAYYTALKITKKQQDAEDIVQDAYIKAFTSLDLLTDDNKFESWFNCIVANKCRDLLEKKKPDLFSKFETDDSELAFEDTLENQDISLLPQSVTENEATHQLVMECIEKLPDEQRVCIVMFYYDELSVKEIALTLEIPEGTVKSRLSKARKTLKKEFENIEERDKIKLHALPYVPLLRWAFQNPSKSDCAAKTIYHRILKNILKNLSQSGKLAKGVGILSSTAVVKIVSVVVAVSVAVTAAGFGIKDYINSRGAQNNNDAAIRTDISNTTESDNSASYYSESPLAVYSRDKKISTMYLMMVLFRNQQHRKQKSLQIMCPKILCLRTGLCIFSKASSTHMMTVDYKNSRKLTVLYCMHMIINCSAFLPTENQLIRLIRIINPLQNGI